MWVASLAAAFQMFNAVFLSSPVADEADFQRADRTGNPVHGGARASLVVLGLRGLAGGAGAEAHSQNLRAARDCNSPLRCRA